MSGLRTYAIFVTILAIVTVLSLGTFVNQVSADEEISICRGEVLTVSAQLLQNGSFGDPVSFQDVEFFDETCNLFLSLVKTDENGYAQLDWPVPMDHPLGLTYINVTFRGNDSLALSPTFQRGVVYVYSSTNMILHIENTIIAPGDNLEFVVEIQDDSSRYLAGKLITISYMEFHLVSGVTNLTGMAYFSINCNGSWTGLGIKNLDVTFEKDTIEYNAVTTKTFSVSIEKIETEFEILDTIPDTLLLNDTFDLTLRTVADFEVLSDISLNVYLDDSFITTTSTNESGLFFLSTIIDDSFSLGPHSILVEYSGDERYEPITFRAEFIVRSNIVYRVNITNPIIVGLQTDFQIMVRDDFNRSISDVNITLYDTETEQATTVPISTENDFTDIFLDILGSKGSRILEFTVSGNPYLIDGSWITNITVWVLPTIFLIDSNTIGYASPLQQIITSFQINGSEGTYIDRPILLTFENGTIIGLFSTDYNGVVEVSWVAPSIQKQYNFSVVFNGIISNFELPARFSYTVIVSELIPARVRLQDYRVIGPLQELYVSLSIQALNGSFLEGVAISYNWLGREGVVVSQPNGLVELHISVPLVHGSYNLDYEVQILSGLLPCKGSIIILLDWLDVQSAEGIGLFSVATSFCTSIGLVSLPRFRRKYLIS